MSEQRRKSTGTTPVRPSQRQSRLGLAALVLGVLALPAALMPVLGIIIAVVVLVVGLIALVRAVRVPEISWTYPGIAVVVAVLALAAASLVTGAADDRIRDCGATTVDQANDCLQNGK